MFRKNKELQKKVIPLFNIYDNKLDSLVDNLDKKIIIWPIRNIKNP